MNLNLGGLTAVVTGGSSGTGAAIVRVLAAEGCNVVFCGRNQERIDAMLDTVAGLRGKVAGTRLDVTDQPAFAAWLAAVGSFDIFIPNVGALSDDWQATLATDIQATVDATQAALPFLARSSHGAINYTGSKAGSLAAPRSPAYGAGKAAMAHYMKSLSARPLPAVRVNTVSPGDTLADRGYWDQVRLEQPDVYAGVVAPNPLGRLAAADEIARVVAFVSSPAASFIAGANWYVDGGSINHVQT